jgi:hypothetical protein
MGVTAIDRDVGHPTRRRSSMSMWYYLVKRNWRATEAACPLYAGLGGDAWPMSPATPALRSAHGEFMRSRAWTPFGDSGDLLCQDRELAQRIHTLADTASPSGAWLLAIHPVPAPVDAAFDGYDVGHANGGYSVIESEILIAGGARVALNQLALFPSVESLEAFLESRDPDAGLEEIQDMPMVGIQVLRRPRVSGAQQGNEG